MTKKVHTELVDLLNEAKTWAEMKREADKAYKPLAERIKTFMRENNLDELVTPEGAKAKLFKQNRVNLDREAAIDLLGDETFELIVNRITVSALKIS